VIRPGSTAVSGKEKIHDIERGMDCQFIQCRLEVLLGIFSSFFYGVNKKTNVVVVCVVDFRLT
jgi:hypothetical protein